MNIQIPYGDTFQKLDTDCGFELLESGIGRLSGSGNQEELVKAAMEHPIQSLPLSALAEKKKKAVLIISDHTRPVPSKFIVPRMLEEMRRGNPDMDITLLVATGCHRGTTKRELIGKLGAKIVEEEKIVVHDCDASPCTHMGTLPSGAPLLVNSLVAEADLVAAEGFIEPHFFAGFSGGRKSILPGVCKRVTVLGNHCADFINDENARMGNLDRNPVNRDMEAAAELAGLAFIVNVIIDEQKKIVKAFAGDPVRAHRTGCEYLRQFCSVTAARPGDIVITSNGGAPLDQNVYQAVKGMTAAEAAAAPGAVIIMCAYCQDGIGGDQFYRALCTCGSARELLNEISKVAMDDTVPDQWQYQILARILDRHHVLFVTRPELKEPIEEMKMEYCSSLEEAFRRARTIKGESAGLTVIPNGVSLIVNTSAAL